MLIMNATEQLPESIIARSAPSFEQYPDLKMSHMAMQHDGAPQKRPSIQMGKRIGSIPRNAETFFENSEDGGMLFKRRDSIFDSTININNDGIAAFVQRLSPYFTLYATSVGNARENIIRNTAETEKIFMQTVYDMKLPPKHFSVVFI